MIALADAGLAARPPSAGPRPRAGCSTRRSAARATGRSAGRAWPRRLGVRVRERQLPRHRRHRRGRAGPATARPERRAAGTARPSSARPALADRACSPRTAAGARSTPTTPASWSTSCRSATSARSSTRRSADVTAHIVEAFAAEGLAAETGLQAGRDLAAAGPGSGRVLVRPLGRELRLRHRRRRARADRRRRPARQAARSAARSPGSSRHQNPTAAGARTCAPTTTQELGGKGASTASQTAWALLALLAAGERGSEATSSAASAGWRETQRADGTWDEPQYTGTGFPGDFYINYHLYRLAFPVSALGRYVRGTSHD